MNYKELFFLSALIASLVFIILSFDAIQQFDKRKGLTNQQKNYLYSVSIFIPLLGFIITRRLKKELLWSVTCFFTTNIQVRGFLEIPL